MSAWRPLSVALLLAGLVALALAPAALAQPEEELDDVSAQIKRQMEKIIQLMRKNEDALLRASAGERARPVRVDVEPPALPERPGAEGSEASGSEGRQPPPSGAEAAEEMEKLLREQQRTAKRIPTELEELVRMVPL